MMRIISICKSQQLLQNKEVSYFSADTLVLNTCKYIHYEINMHADSYFPDVLTGKGSICMIIKQRLINVLTSHYTISVIWTMLLLTECKMLHVKQLTGLACKACSDI